MLWSHQLILEKCKALNWKNVLGVTSITTFVTFASSFSVQAASFDCTGALTETEAAICNDEELSTLDTILGYVWEDALETLVRAEERAGETNIQTNWLATRSSCGSQTNCIKEAYQTRLAEWPFMLGSINRVELYDFLTETFSSYFITNSGAFSPSNALMYVFHIDREDPQLVPWLLAELTLDGNTSCNVDVLDSSGANFSSRNYQVGWTNIIPDHEFSSMFLMPGEIIVHTKAGGAGDWSSISFFRLTGGQLIENRSLIDDCEDRDRHYSSAYFDHLIEKSETLELQVASSELLLEGELFENYEGLSRQCVDESPNMEIIRICLMQLADARMRSVLEARMLLVREASSDQAVNRLNETQAAFEEYRSSSCGLILDINDGWIADDAAMNCYNRLTDQRTEFLNTQWLPN
ncbi:DUF1311 domain-containing protein [Rhodobacterales bacterium LSUCC1028]|nr:DUF1311 domain-containing protein [Rhodobacterales bacterium LSUCC1028]